MIIQPKMMMMIGSNDNEEHSVVATMLLLYWDWGGKNVPPSVHKMAGSLAWLCCVLHVRGGVFFDFWRALEMTHDVELEWLCARLGSSALLCSHFRSMSMSVLSTLSRTTKSL